MLNAMASHRTTISAKANPGIRDPKKIPDQATFKASCAKNTSKAKRAPPSVCTPHQPGRNRHQHVESGPYRAEDPTGRSTCGLAKTRIPVANAAGGKEGSQAPCSQTDGEKDDQHQRRLRVHESIVEELSVVSYQLSAISRQLKTAGPGDDLSISQVGHFNAWELVDEMRTAKTPWSCSAG